ncbi:hypothetical protein SAMN05216410_3509 [Sanguibacter gelidistatuariae]|uniref:ABC-2 family transporter protein n=1 Tax=Sanguibacter gelidistatuariae TaxID=1814289 RepID=A0A1G6VQC3_9MICO|nr:ABC transporter permease [Sanguibacter gelidistatuariae]SDD55850.1 hypothetical protein SAMN05216410_3509 [Sanguibacter gelidistatuariae]
MKASLISEYRKLITTRMWWILLIAMAGYMAFLGAVMAWSITSAPVDPSSPLPPVTPELILSSVYSTAATFGYVFPVIIGALSVTGEFRHKTITPTFLAEPNRLRVLWAKLGASVPIGAFYGLAGTLSTAAAGAAVLAVTGHPTLLGDGETWAALGRSVLALTLWAPVGVALGALIINQVVAIIVVLVYTQFLEAILRLGLTSIGDAGATISTYLPGAASEAIAGGSIYTSIGIGELLPWGAGVAVLAGYAVVCSMIAALTTLRRDVA